MDVYPVVASATRGSVGPHANISLPNGLTDYTALGAYTSSPDQNLGFYFSGMQSASGGELGLSVSSDSDPEHVAIPRPQFFKVNMEQADNATFTVLTWPSWLTPRAEGSLVWLPYGEDGVLLAIGGVEIPGDQFLTLPDNATTDANKAGPFMNQIAVYDIASDSWSLQNILGGTQPGQLAGFCTVVAETQDQSSYSIYVYGGYDGTYITNQAAYDEVWVLSVPSFQWTRVNTGSTDHRRQSHICVSPNPTTMMSIGGSIELGSYLQTNQAIDFFDLNTLTWTGKFDPSSTTKYELPSVITQQIGGSSTGLGTAAALPSGLNSTLTNVFSTKYRGIRTAYQPFNCSGTLPTSPGGPTPVPQPKHSNVAVIAGAVVGAIGALLIAGLIFWFCRRKNKSKAAGVARTEARDRKVHSWFVKTSTPVDPKAAQSATSDGSGDTMVETRGYFSPKSPDNAIHEAPSNVTSPGAFSPASHGTPVMTSLNYQGSPELDGSSRHHEIMDQQTNRESMSIRNHPYYPLSVAGPQTRSGQSDSVSHTSDHLYPSYLRGQISPYELPQDKSNENLSQPPNDLSLDQDVVSNGRAMTDSSYGVFAHPIQSPTLMSPTSPIIRKPVNVDRQNSATIHSPTDPFRPSHNRHSSSMSSNLPTSTLPSPGVAEDQRRSRYIDNLPDRTESANTYLQSYNRQSGPVHSIYREEFGESQEKAEREPRRS